MAKDTISVTFETREPSETGFENSDDHQKTINSIVLVPQPSDDPDDPLNWTAKRKIIITITLCIALLAGYSAALCGQLNLVQQAKLYHKTVTEITYFNSAASAGIATGGFIWFPLSKRFGPSSVIFWTLLGCLGTQIWGPMMTGSHQYVPYLISRYFSGFFGMATSVLGPRYLTDIFFLHQRGRAFTILHTALNFGTTAGPTFSGFIAANHHWPVEYWWSIGVVSLAIILVFLFLEDTTYDRSNVNPPRPRSWGQSRIQTFFFGQKLPGTLSILDTVASAIKPFKLALAPVILLISSFDTISFGLYIALNALSPTWLQKPVKIGGYGFNVTENAAFTFSHWIGVLLGLAYGQFFSDRIPLWLVARNNGNWKPEYRLYTLIITSLILEPIGLGLVGAALQYHLHWIVFGLGQVLVTIGCSVSLPVTVNYICECFRTHTSEAVIPANSIRLLFGLSVNFYSVEWVSKVGIGWFYGMMAFFSAFSFVFIVALMLWGHKIRQWTPFGMESSEEGAHLVAGNNLNESEKI